jgi:fatty acid CoA ligase FadD9
MPAGSFSLAGLLSSLRSGGADQPVAEAVRRAVQATLACGPEDLRGDARFADVGGDSLSALKISKLLEEIFDTEVPVGVVIDPTSDLYLLANYIEKNRNNGRKRPTSASVMAGTNPRCASDLTLDKFIDAETLTAATTLARPSDAVQTVLLTGATGYLGRFLCMEWLQRLSRSHGKLICVARGLDAAAARRRIAESGDRRRQRAADLGRLGQGGGGPGGGHGRQRDRGGELQHRGHLRQGWSEKR